MTPRHRRDGFSLVELLIVIAIFGVLAALILLGVSSARDKAHDNSIRSSIGQIRWLAEIVYDSRGASYLNWTDHISVEEELPILLDDIDKNYGDTETGSYVTVLCESQTKDYCISAPLRSQAGKHYCIDASAIFTTTDAACNCVVDTGDPLECPSS